MTDTDDQTGLVAPAPMPYNLRPRNNSQDNNGRGGGSPPGDGGAWTFQLFSSALRNNARALKKDAIDEIVLDQYNKAWQWFLLSHEEGEIKNQARVAVQHKHEDLNAVWTRILQELENPGAIMLAMHL